MNKTFHFFLTHKGGVGKSWSAIQLINYLKDFKEYKVQCFDTDPQNQTLFKYKGLPVKQLKLIDEETKTIDTRNYDALIEVELPNLDADVSHIIIDVGSSSYGTLLSYIGENPLIPVLQNFGDIFIHASLNGGQAYDETISCVEHLISVFPHLPIVLWENRHLAGRVANSEGVHFLDDPKYKKIIHKAYQVYNIKIPFLNKDTYGKDLEALSAKNITITEAQCDKRYASSLMVKQRLINFQRLMFNEIENANFIPISDES